MCETPEFFGNAELLQPESLLYLPLKDYLISAFHAELKPQHGSWRIIVEETSNVADPLGGQWTRPDVSAVGVSRRKFSANAVVDVMSFEVKTFITGAELSAVHETLAHLRFVNFAYLVWNRPYCVCNDRRYEIIQANCRLYGLGLITAHKPSDIRTWTIRCQPARSSVSDDQLNAFIESRFTAPKQALILDALRHYCHNQP